MKDYASCRQLAKNNKNELNPDTLQKMFKNYKKPERFMNEVYEPLSYKDLCDENFTKDLRRAVKDYVKVTKLFRIRFIHAWQSSK